MEVAELENSIINADCLDILRQLPDKCVDLVLTDPPYGIGASSNIRKGTQHGKALAKSGMNYEVKDWDNYSPDRELFSEIFRVSKNQIIWGGITLLSFCREVPAGSSGIKKRELTVTPIASLHSQVTQLQFVYSGTDGWECYKGICRTKN